MTERPGAKWHEKVMWLTLGAVIYALVGLGADLIREKKPSLYYVIGKPQGALRGKTRCFVGAVRLGNDGDVPIREWEATISFSGNAEVLYFGSSSEMRIWDRRPGSGEPYARTQELKAVGLMDSLNPGESLDYMYVATSEQPPTVKFKGPGATARQRHARSQTPRPKTALTLITFASGLAWTIGAGGLFLCVAHSLSNWRSCRKIKGKKQ